MTEGWQAWAARYRMLDLASVRATQYVPSEPSAWASVCHILSCGLCCKRPLESIRLPNDFSIRQNGVNTGALHGAVNEELQEPQVQTRCWSDCRWGP
jgi:hypothetical protein